MCAEGSDNKKQSEDSSHTAKACSGKAAQKQHKVGYDDSEQLQGHIICELESRRWVCHTVRARGSVKDPR